MTSYRSFATHSEKSSGIALPSTLIAIFLGLFVLRLAQLKTSGVVQLRSDLRLVHNLKQDLLRSLSNDGSGETRCQEVLGKHQNEQRKWLTCRELPSPYRTIPVTELPTPHFDFDALFREAIKCPGQVVSSTSRRQAIPYSSRSCLFRALTINGLTLLENIEGASLSVTKTVLHKSSIIATPGRFAVEQVLQTEGDLLIVAGGDVFINKIESRSLQPIRVTIVSARGNIAVVTVGTGVHALVVGRGTMRVPSTTLLPPYPLPSQAATPRTIGILRGDLPSTIPPALLK
jgi:hypothetical protein